MSRPLIPVKGPRLPQVVSRMRDDDAPPVAAADERPSYLPEYRPEIGIFPRIGLILQEDEAFILAEDESFIRYA